MLTTTKKNKTTIIIKDGRGRTRAKLKQGYYSEGWVLWKLCSDFYNTAADLEQILNILKELNESN